MDLRINMIKTLTRGVSEAYFYTVTISSPSKRNPNPKSKQFSCADDAAS